MNSASLSLARTSFHEPNAISFSERQQETKCGSEKIQDKSVNLQNTSLISQTFKSKVGKEGETEMVPSSHNYKGHESSHSNSSLSFLPFIFTLKRGERTHLVIFKCSLFLSLPTIIIIFH